MCIKNKLFFFFKYDIFVIQVDFYVNFTCFFATLIRFMKRIRIRRIETDPVPQHCFFINTNVPNDIGVAGAGGLHEGGAVPLHAAVLNVGSHGQQNLKQKISNEGSSTGNAKKEIVQYPPGKVQKQRISLFSLLSTRKK